jgi:hypothetical protein
MMPEEMVMTWSYEPDWLKLKRARPTGLLNLCKFIE